MLCECKSIILPSDEKCEKCGKENPNVKSEDYSRELMDYHVEINGENKTVEEWLSDCKNYEQINNFKNILNNLYKDTNVYKITKIETIIMAVEVYAYRKGLTSKEEFENEIKKTEQFIFECGANATAIRTENYRMRVEFLQETIRGFLLFLAPTEEMIQFYQREYREVMGEEADIYRIDEELDLIKWVGYTPKQIFEKLNDHTITEKIKTYIYWSALYELLDDELMEMYDEEFMNVRKSKLANSFIYVDCMRKMMSIAEKNKFSVRKHEIDAIKNKEELLIFKFGAMVSDYAVKLDERKSGYSKQELSELKDYMRNEFGKCRYLQLDRNDQLLINQTLKEGCYIATAVYGDYNAYEVIALRKFRDDVLKKTSIGRMLIKCYYSISPKLSIFMKNKKYINSVVRNVLNYLIKILER